VLNLNMFVSKGSVLRVRPPTEAPSHASASGVPDTKGNCELAGAFQSVVAAYTRELSAY
jgi:hypothetical protein